MYLVAVTVSGFFFLIFICVQVKNSSTFDMQPCGSMSVVKKIYPDESEGRTSILRELWLYTTA